MTSAIIVAGGRGTRAHSMTGDRVPKALLPVAGIPIIVHQLRLLRREGIRRVGLLAGHLGDVLADTAQAEARRLDLDLAVAIEAEPLGTAGGLPALAHVIGDDATVVLYGDVVCDLALDRLLAAHQQAQALVTIVAHPNDHPETSDLLATDDDGRVTAVLARRHRPPGDYRNLVPAAVYVCQERVLNYLRPSEPADFIHDLFPRLLAAGERLMVYNTPEYLRDMGTPARFATAEADLQSGLVASLNVRHRRPAILFDCDGVLNEEVGGHGVLSPNDVRLTTGAAAAVSQARAAGYVTVGVTNRPQVAKGMITADQLTAILGRLETLLARDGAVLDRLYTCPHHPERGFPGEVPALKIDCDCRKPAPGMLLRAIDDLPIDPARSAIIGDTWRDIVAGRRAGVAAYAVRTGYGCRELPPAVYPDGWFDDVAEAVAYCLSARRLASAARARLIAQASPRRQLVAVCGQSRSGKSLLAHALASGLAEAGVPAVVVRLDDWIVPAADRPAGMDVLARNRVAAYPAIVQAAAQGVDLTAPGYVPATRAAGAPTTYQLADAGVVILDGLLASHASIRESIDLTIFVDASPEVRQARLARFYQWKALTDQEIAALIQQRRVDEWPIVEAQRARADVIVASGQGVT